MTAGIQVALEKVIHRGRVEWAVEYSSKRLAGEPEVVPVTVTVPGADGGPPVSVTHDIEKPVFESQHAEGHAVVPPGGALLLYVGESAGRHPLWRLPVVGKWFADSPKYRCYRYVLVRPEADAAEAAPESVVSDIEPIAAPSGCARRSRRRAISGRTTRPTPWTRGNSCWGRSVVGPSGGRYAST